MTDDSQYLMTLARRIAAAYLATTGPRTILLTGSAATGESDRYSDLDLIVYYESLVDTSLNLVGVLAGLNRRYFSRFQFKRLHHFVETMAWTPERFADRLDELFTLDPASAGAAMEQLVAETLALVEVHMPTLDTAAARRHLGMRQSPWKPEAK